MYNVSGRTFMMDLIICVIDGVLSVLSICGDLVYCIIEDLSEEMDHKNPCIRCKIRLK